MHLSMIFPRAGLAGIPWGLDRQSSHYPQAFDRQLWHRSGTLDFSTRKTRRKTKKHARFIRYSMHQKVSRTDARTDARTHDQPETNMPRQLLRSWGLNYVEIWRYVHGILDTKLCHMGRELYPIFFLNCPIPWGNLAPPPLPSPRPPTIQHHRRWIAFLWFNPAEVTSKWTF